MNLSKLFLKNLLIWGAYVCTCAAPSFSAAYFCGFNNGRACAGMALGALSIASFFAILETFFLDAYYYPHLHRTLHWTLRFRTLVSLVSFLPFLRFFLVPDFLIGVLTMSAVDRMQAVGWQTFPGSSLSKESFGVVFLSTVVGGFYTAVSLFLLMPLSHGFIKKYWPC